MKTTSTNLAQTVSTLFDARMVRFPQVDTKLDEFADLCDSVEPGPLAQAARFDKFLSDLKQSKQ